MFKKIIILGLLVIFGLLFIIFLTNFIDVFGQGQFETDLESFIIDSRTLPIIPFVRCITSILFCLFIYNFLKIMYLGDETNHESCPYLGRSFCKGCTKLNYYTYKSIDFFTDLYKCDLLGYYVDPNKSPLDNLYYLASDKYPQGNIFNSESTIRKKNILKKILFIIVSVFVSIIVYLLWEFTLFRIFISLIAISFLFIVFV